MSQGRALAAAVPSPNVLAAWLPRQRWFAHKTRRITRVRVVDAVPLAGACIVILEVGLDDATAHGYAAPLRPGSTVVDALDDPAFCRALLTLMAGGGTAEGTGGTLRGVAVVSTLLELPADVPVRRLPGEQSNTSVLFERALILKFFRTHVPGINPEVEMGRFLTEHGSFSGTPRLAGHLEYRGGDGPAAVAVVQELVTGARDGWEWVLEQLAEFYGQAAAAGGAAAAERVAALAGPSLAALRRLGEQTAALHRTLASDTRDPAFAPAPITADDLVAWTAGIRAQVERARTVVDSTPGLDGVPDVATGLGSQRGCHKIRPHRDLHHGQTLYPPGAGELAINDIEGEPVRPLQERRRPHAAVRDAAGLLRSLDYAVVAARKGGADELAPWGEAWRAEATRAYLEGYRATAAGAAFLPTTDAGFVAALAACELEKAAYEVVYEANHRPAWIDIPRRGLIEAAARLRGRPTA
jgi:maltose alpha-D-glucosyltransferase/alpha-amylase